MIKARAQAIVNSKSTEINHWYSYKQKNGEDEGIRIRGEIGYRTGAVICDKKYIQSKTIILKLLDMQS
ncbi:unnamed protein product [Orchesella dallaii]|uniref:Uncharacterized protein n=1 Tax=Orchesella dallaii TaxID=48710 RepID=A0ABP1QG00_9HEXA